MVTKRFRVSYGGDAEYEISAPGENYDRRSVSIRAFANRNFGYAPGVLEQEIIPFIGAIRWVGNPHYNEFPPPEVCALFPGYTPARYTLEWTVEYNGPAPVLEDPAPPGFSRDQIVARVWAEEHRRLFAGPPYTTDADADDIPAAVLEGRACYDDGPQDTRDL